MKCHVSVGYWCGNNDQKWITFLSRSFHFERVSLKRKLLCRVTADKGGKSRTKADVSWYAIRRQEIDAVFPSSSLTLSSIPPSNYMFSLL